MSLRFPDARRPEVVVTTAWLAAALGLDASARASRAGLVVLDVSWSKGATPASYLEGHVPGAIHLDTDDLETGYPVWRLRPLNELREVIGGHSIGTATTVVVYGGQLIAVARAWWALMYAGVRDVRVLDRGLTGWIAAGLAVERGLRQPDAVVFDAEPRAALLASTAYVRDRLSDRGAQIVDVRSEAEFEGRVSGYDYLDATGRIPGAIHAGDADDAANVYVTGDGGLGDPSEIAARWAACGLAPAAELVFSCGSGWRSSLAFLHAWLLGYDHIRNYSDGWAGWSTVYVPDAAAAGSTPGWRQLPTGNPSSGQSIEFGKTVAAVADPGSCSPRYSPSPAKSGEGAGG